MWDDRKKNRIETIDTALSGTSMNVRALQDIVLEYAGMSNEALKQYKQHEASLKEKEKAVSSHDSSSSVNNKNKSP